MPKVNYRALVAFVAAAIIYGAAALGYLPTTEADALALICAIYGGIDLVGPRRAAATLLRAAGLLSEEQAQKREKRKKKNEDQEA